MQLASIWWQQKELSPEPFRVFRIFSGLGVVSICGSIRLEKAGSGDVAAYFEQCLVELDDFWLKNFRSCLLRKGRSLHNDSDDLQTDPRSIKYYCMEGSVPSSVHLKWPRHQPLCQRIQPHVLSIDLDVTGTRGWIFLDRFDKFIEGSCIEHMERCYI
jgi:hypothetical protein